MTETRKERHTMNTISVWLKTKPLEEKSTVASSCVSPTSQTKVVYHHHDSSRLEFTFNRVVSENTTQEEVFECGIPSFLRQAFAGKNILIATYGQTNSGKTYTMIGDICREECQGILPRTLQYCMESRQPRTQIQLEMIEIYNEEVRDLFLSPEGHTTKIQIRNDSKYGTVVQGLQEVKVSTYSQAIQGIREGLKNRSVSETKMNKASSRSHCIVFVTLLDEASQAILGRVGLVDLAGSERQAKTGASGAHLKEGGSINRSLSALEKVVNELYQKQKRPSMHVNFRDSKLTRLLQPFLSSEGHSIFILCVSPDSKNSQETLNTIKFGTRLQGISKWVVVLEAPASSEEDLALHGIGKKELIGAPQLSFAASFLREFAWFIIGMITFSSIQRILDS